MHTQPRLTHTTDVSAVLPAARAEHAPAGAGANEAASPQAPAGATQLAQLLIHTGDGAATGRTTMLSRTRAWAQAARAPWAPPPATLRVADIHGRQFFCADTLAADVSVPLPAGTYHVSFTLGGQPRRYTVALEPGASFDLHLPALAGPR